MIDMIINYNILFMIDIRLIFDPCASTCDYDSRLWLCRKQLLQFLCLDLNEKINKLLDNSRQGRIYIEIANDYFRSLKFGA